MPRPIAMSVRQSIVLSHKQGERICDLSRKYGINRKTIRNLIKSYREKGEAGLQPLYSNCGKVRPNASEFVYRAVRCLRCWHPHWGAAKIHAEMKRMRPDLTLPSVRTLFRWFHWNGQIKSRSKTPKEPRRWANHLHEAWQIDAKDEIKIANGEEQCWLNITDEHSGTVIDPPVFPLQENM